MPETGEGRVLGVEDGAVTIVSDDDDESKGVAPMGRGQEGEGVGHLGTELEDSALGVGDDGIFWCEDSVLKRVMI